MNPVVELRAAHAKSLCGFADFEAQEGQVDGDGFDWRLPRGMTAFRFSRWIDNPSPQRRVENRRQSAECRSKTACICQRFA